VLGTTIPVPPRAVSPGVCSLISGRHFATVIRWGSRGYGFARLDDGREVIIHRLTLEQAGLARLVAGEHLLVEIIEMPDGRLRAREIVRPPSLKWPSFHPAPSKGLTDTEGS
jgi:cold shock CspA family protein